MNKAQQELKRIIRGFNNWEKGILMEYESDVDIFLTNFVHETDKQDFLHNFADVLFRCKSNSLEAGKQEILKDVVTKEEFTILRNHLRKELLDELKSKNVNCVGMSKDFIKGSNWCNGLWKNHIRELESKLLGEKG